MSIRITARSLAAAAVGLSLVSGFGAEGVSFAHRPILAGKASLASDGFEVSRTLGVAAISPELQIPVELVYDSAAELSGAFGYGWRSPQLESSVRWDKDGVLWTAPWGEKVKFFPKKEKTPKDAVKLEPIEEAKKGNGLYAPYSDWEADANSSDYAKARQFSVTGKNGLADWRFAYEDGRLVRVETPNGTAAAFEYGAAGELLAVSSQGTRFIELVHGAKDLVSSLRLNGVPVAFSYADVRHVVLPKTKDGIPVPKVAPALSSVGIASLDSEVFAYVNGYLASTARGKRVETLSVDGKGRLLADGDYDYSYAGGVQVKDKVGRTASYAYDEKNGIFTATDFTGRSTTTYYFMRYDAAYLGKVRKVVDGRGRDLVAFRYDKRTGKPVRVTDLLGNKRILEYDAKGNCTKLSRRADWSLSEEPVRSFAYDRKNRLSFVSELDADGKPARTTSLSYDKQGRPTRVTDGRRVVSVAYSPSGFPVALKDDFSSVALAYDRYNRLVSSIDPYGIVTTRTYADHGGLAKVERKDGSVLLSSISVGYDKSGLPVSVTDQDGCTTACDRDALGRIVKERYANDTEVAYGYDKLGRLATVLDENGHEIKFGWDRFGLSSRLTAADQLTDMKRDANGLVTSVTASKDGKADRTIRREYDEFDRVTKVDYGNGETETFAYDKWGRLAAHTRGKLKETYIYDHFGRLAQKDENGLVYTYGYDAYGNRTSRTVRSPAGETTEERRSYDKYGRLVEIASLGTSVKYRYDAKGRIARQTVDGSPIDFAYTKYGQLAGKYLGGKEKPDAAVEYEYSRSGQIVARTANGVRQTYEYDGRGQLLAVKEDGVHVERYAYDKAGNMTKKALLRRGHVDPTKPPTLADYVITTFTFDGANQLVSSTTDGVTTQYAYDAAGRLVKEGGKTYRYGYLDKVLSVTEGAKTYSYDYHVDGLLARADYGNGRAEDFGWDGLALIRRGDERFVNEPHVGGGNPVASSKGTTYFNDMLGTTVGIWEGRASSRPKSGRKYTPAALTAFGEDISALGTKHQAPSTFYTGKPEVAGLGHTFLFRNYRASLAKWQTADPMGYPDGWNQLAYCGNVVICSADLLGCVAYDPRGLTPDELAEFSAALNNWLRGSFLESLFSGRPLTIDFLSRYVNKSGDQQIAYGNISGEQKIASINETIVTRVKSGGARSGSFPIAGSAWENEDLSTSLGGVTVYYETIDVYENGYWWYHAYCWIDDPYDFHSPLNVQMPFLDWFWDGGDIVYDSWMRQLAENNFASVFNTLIKWKLVFE